MPKFSVVDERLIDAPSIEVFNAVLDEYSGVTHLWMPHFEFHPRANNPMNEAGTICDSVSHSHGMPAKLVKTETRVELGRALDFELSGSFTGTEKWTFEPTEDGKTKVQIAWKGASNSLAVRVFGRFPKVEKWLHESRNRFLIDLEKSINKKL